MSLESELSDHFQRNEYTWHLKGDRVVIPSETDMLEALDKAAEILYAEDTGSVLEVGRLIIIKTTNGFDVYALFGSYT
jgi:hypothetical protein